MPALTYLSAIRLSGADAGEFLHNQLSADILALSDGQSTFACYCEPKGRVLALMLVCRTGDDYCVIMSRELVSAITGRLKIYVMRSKVSIEALDESGIFGLETGEALPASFTALLSIPAPGNDGQYVLTTENVIMDTKSASPGAWKVSELQRGIVWTDSDTSGQFLPQMLGFDRLGAVNFRKGCYPGQEIVARTHYLGKVKRHPRLLSSGELDCPAAMEKIGILSGDSKFEAVVVDCGQTRDGDSCIFTVTRMDPELVAEKVEHQDRICQLN